MLATFSAEDLIVASRQNPPEPIIEGLLFCNDICLVHGQEESYKSFWIFQLADNIASGTAVLRRFPVTKARRVGIVETELHENQLGMRLTQMYANGKPSENLRIFGAMKEFRAEHSLLERLKLIKDWVMQERIEVLFLDIASDFFRGKDESPSDERVVASFFEGLRDMQLTSVVVRHDHKPRVDDLQDGNSNNRIRGSGEWKEDPEVVMWLAREDRASSGCCRAVSSCGSGPCSASWSAWRSSC